MIFMKYMRIGNEKMYALRSQWNSQQFRHDKWLDQETLKENWEEKTDEKANIW